MRHLTPCERAIILALNAHPCMTTAEIGSVVGRGMRLVSGSITALLQEGFVRGMPPKQIGRLKLRTYSTSEAGNAALDVPEPPRTLRAKTPTPMAPGRYASVFHMAQGVAA